jgi:hypothetical protein
MNNVEQSRSNISEWLSIEVQDFSKDDYMHLWEYFSDRADMLKDRLWTMATWLLGFNSAILGFIFGTSLIAFDSTGSTIHAPAFVLALALAGCILCLYAFFLIYDYGTHIQRNWDRAGVFKAKLPLVMEALAGKSSAETGQTDGTSTWLGRIGQYLKAKLQKKFKRIARLPKIALYLGGFALGYFIIFLAIGAFALIIFFVNPAAT